MSIYEILGYSASLLVMISLLMKSIVSLRTINTIGAATFVVYGLCIHAYPVAIMNGLIIIINVYHLCRYKKSNTSKQKTQ